MKVLMIADIFSEPGRQLVRDLLPGVKEKYSADICIANGENVAGGFGLTPKTAGQLFSSGVDILTMGNHVWDRRDIFDIIEDERIIRPANYPPGVPGRGWGVFNLDKKTKVGVVNLAGRVYMSNIECPFRTADKVIEEIKKQTNIIIVDMHAEVTSEKNALGWYLDGRVSAVVGTHTHIPTADERILPDGTAYITDMGMTGSLDSVIGIKKEIAIQRFLTQMPIRFEAANDNVVLAGVVIDIDTASGKATAIERIKVQS
ncbi:MAG: TIGR00282 family metallophosphoesterase [bacterium]